MTATESPGRLVYYRVLDVNHAGISEVLPGSLYISGICALRASVIEEYGITLIINATSEVPNSASLGKLPRIKLWLDDTQDSWALSYMDFVCNKILKVITRGGKVLIHSVQGVSRCATICLAFLTKYKFKTLRDAYMYLASVRPKVQPNIGFWRQLISFEQDLKQSNGSVKIVRNQNDPSILVPDVYEKFFLRNRKKLQHTGNINGILEEDDNEALLQKQLSIQTSSQKELSTDCNNQKTTNEEQQLCETVSLSVVENGMINTESSNETVQDASRNSARSKAALLSDRKSSTYRRKSSLKKKFQPVLEPLIEVV
uniref:Tyrosine-protein phosphatase domain-containing protein n=1 Tax=Setaria digitata TaxID=48799 RepID=A0A915Q7L8_9BILA